VTQIVVNQERSAGRGIQWREIALPPLPGLQPGTRAFGSDQTKCTVMVSHWQRWHVSIAHPFRLPSWDEVASARYALVPGDVCMAMMLPPEDEYVNLHPTCFHLHECRCEQEAK